VVEEIKKLNRFTDKLQCIQHLFKDSDIPVNGSTESTGSSWLVQKTKEKPFEDG